MSAVDKIHTLIASIAGPMEDWWKTTSPLQKHAYLTAHPNSKYAADKPQTAPPVKTREDYHLASAAFHKGATAHHEAERSKVLDKPPKNMKAYELKQSGHWASRDAHEKLRAAHLKAYSHLNVYKASPNESAKKKYNASLEDIGKQYKSLENTAKVAKFPIGKGHTHYISKDDK